MSGPDPALSAVARAIHDADCGCASIDDEHDMTQYPESYVDLAGAALAAARPLIEAEARERIARGIGALGPDEFGRISKGLALHVCEDPNDPPMYLVDPEAVETWQAVQSAIARGSDA